MERTHTIKTYDRQGVKVEFFNYAINRVEGKQSDIVFDLENIDSLNEEKPFLGIILLVHGTYSTVTKESFWDYYRQNADKLVGACIIKRYTTQDYLFHTVEIPDEMGHCYADLTEEMLGLI